MSSLSDDQIHQLRKVLEQAQSELLEQLDIGKSATDVVTLDQTLVGRVSRIDAMQQQSMAQSTRQKANLRLRKIQAALRDMADGEYGYCRQCDEDIAFQRLLAQPEARLCVSCQNRADQQ